MDIMIEYPSMQNSSKAPRKQCIAFEKLDGSNVRVKWTSKNGFSLFGTRTQLIDENTPFWGNVVATFRNELEDDLQLVMEQFFKKEREVIVFGEYWGKNSFAGNHDANEKQKIVVFDILVGHKQRKFLKPQEFIKMMPKFIETPRVLYQGKLNDQFIKDVRDDKFDTFEGAICKGTESVGNARGNVWMCKIKTDKYIQKLKDRFDDNWQKYGE